MSDVEVGATEPGLLFTAAQFAAARCSQRLLVSYDTPNDRRRRRMAKTISDFIPRVQQSVYEGDLSPVEFRILAKTLRALICCDEDRLLLTPLCTRCSSQQDTLGSNGLGSLGSEPSRCDPWPILGDPGRLIVA